MSIKVTLVKSLNGRNDKHIAWGWITVLQS